MSNNVYYAKQEEMPSLCNILLAYPLYLICESTYCNTCVTAGDRAHKARIRNPPACNVHSNCTLSWTVICVVGENSSHQKAADDWQ